ncbi:HD domain-containing protein [Alienimonas californiensis]|uniref:GTP pyrophosphokinase n=1 Tax=Alienimonas californiensis TaxID=2527989 RepID=A0A517P9I4_9PLAN|nr:HD domain-containing protein [Alienimonas californiensis]QDT16029.1 GTP pyrophosphokinase [Alienimonas californiensis]
MSQPASAEDAGLDPYPGLLIRAARYAALAHAGQTRKDSAEPYVTHPLAVMTLLCRAGWAEDDELLAAAALHDVLEDTEVTPEELAETFPPRVCALVEALSEHKRDERGEKLPWEYRKAEHRARLTAAEEAARALALADKLHNLRCLEEDVTPDRVDPWARFNAPRQRWIEVTRETIEALRCGRTATLADACLAALDGMGTATGSESAP